MTKTIRTNTKHIAFGDVFFCFLEAEKYLTIEIIKKTSNIFCETGGEERIKQNILKDKTTNIEELKNKIIECNNLKEELVKQLKENYRIPEKLIAITGTKGKTSSCWFTMQILGLFGKKCGYIGTLGAYFFDGEKIEKINKEDTLTTPSIDDIYYFLDQFSKRNAEIAVFETSSHALQQGRIDGLHVDFSVFTNLSQDHLDYHKTMNNYFNAKSLLFSKYQKKNDICVINGDDERYNELYDICKKNELKIYSVGQKQHCDVKIKSITQENDHQNVIFNFNNKDFSFKTDILGEFQIYNLLEVLTICKNVLSIDFNKLCEKINKIKAPIGRMQKVGNTNIFVDFAHTPKSLEESIKLLKSRYKNIITVFGCGGNRDKKKRPIMCEIALKLSNFVVITSDNPRFENPHDIIKDIVCFEEKENKNPLFIDDFVNDEINKINTKYQNQNCDFKIIEDRKEAIKFAVNTYLNKQETAVVIAGKGHENYQIIGDVKHHFDDFEEVEKNIK